jgi:hypothetical protein
VGLLDFKVKPFYSLKHKQHYRRGKMKRYLWVVPLVILLCFTFACQEWPSTAIFSWPN